MQLGDRVKVSVACRYFGDWRGWSGFVVGLHVASVTGAISVDVSDHFPPRHLGDVTTDFAITDLEAA